MPGTRFQIEINPRIPRRLARLQDLADNLWYSWHRPTRSLFARLNAWLWHESGNSPKEFADFLAAENEKFSALVKAAGIKAE